ncbi:MAG TPA: sigma 54-interacting transcriptional regulator [Candidatus Paceibacterota bacterium]|nr:sigma 54-interacting transcriptional regulator [Verrucomicrobiota bacterium]HSA09585.1 sigma 54-interacting transcriptional regulator [Candidatus Paceibacterota bacterium]
MSNLQNSTADPAEFASSPAFGTTLRAAVAAHLRRSFQGYLIAVGAVLVAFLLRWWCNPVLQGRLPFAFFLLPIIVTVWLGGLGPSLLATALGALAGGCCFLEPRYSLTGPDPAGWLALAAYFLTGLVVCWYAEKMRRVTRRVEETAEVLKAQQRGLDEQIHARQRVEKALYTSEHRYEALIESIPQLVWTALPDGSFDYASSQWETHTGLPVKESLGELWLRLLHPDDRPGVAAAWSQALKTGRAADFDCRIRCKGEGLHRWFKVRAVPLRDEAGEVVKWFGTCTDVTLLVEAQEALTRTQQELEELVKERTAEVERLKNKLQEEDVYLREKARVSLGHAHHRTVGQSQAIRRALAQAEQVAPTDSTVLLLGETGTGKELLATTIHELSARQDRTLVSVNCAVMPAALVESELFGREKGAFTGSLSRQIGRFELADQSTIFLDEVGELPPEVQAKILRVLEAKQIERLGNPKPIPVDVRIIAATNRDLEKAVADGTFRVDLYYRLNVFPITVPPLRERREDIPLLVWAFVDQFAKTFNKNIESIDRESMDALQRYSWPGNIRELRNLIEREMIVATGRKLHIRLPRAAATPKAAPTRKLNEMEREHILSTLEESGWRVRGPNGAAAKLGLKPTTLEARMAKLDIRRPV